ncbi:hypothetical protein ACOYR1_13690 [Thalassotalea piscium]
MLNNKNIIAVIIISAFMALSACSEQESNQAKIETQVVETPVETAANSFTIQEGIHYTVLQNPINRPANEVLEFFWYGCPHCKDADKYVKTWEKENAGVYQLLQAHSQLSQSWMFDASVFYGLKELDLEKKIHTDYFVERQNGSIKKQADLKIFLQKYDININDMIAALKKDSVIDLRASLHKAELQSKTNGVPSFIVGGKYLVNLEGLAEVGSWKGLGSVLNQLAAKSINEK